MHMPFKTASTSNRSLHSPTNKQIAYKPCIQRLPHPITHSPLTAAKPGFKPRLVLAAASSDDKPEWLKMLEEDAKHDEEVAALLRGTNGNPDEVQRRMKAEMDTLHERITSDGTSGVAKPVEVLVKPHDPFAMWVWIQLYNPPSSTEEEMVQEVIGSWFLLGRLGAFDSGNMQVMYSEATQGEVEYEAREGLAATMHDLGDVDTNGDWMRFWVDMGTADEMAIDILLNALCTLSSGHVGIRRIIIGGDNEEWPADELDNNPLLSFMNERELPDDFGEGENYGI